jgi:hypothetical protein
MVFPESVASGNGATFDPANGLMYVFGVGGVSSHGIQTMNWHNFAPRVGIAYQLDPKTVIRAGYGWAYDLGTFGSTFGHNVTQNPPVLSEQNMAAPNGFTDVFNLAQGPPALTPVTVASNGTFPLPLDVTPKYRPATITLPTTYLYNIAVQRQVTNRIAVTAAYVGNANRHGFLGTGQNFNSNEPSFSPGISNTNLEKPFYNSYGFTQSLSYYCDCFNEEYNSFQGTIKVSAGQCRAATPISGSGAMAGPTTPAITPSMIVPAARATPPCCHASSGRSRRPTKYRSAMAGDTGLT